MLRGNDILKLCRATLKSKTASDEEKRLAKKALRRLEKMDVRRKDALEAVGEKPQREDFESDHTYGEALRLYRTALDRHCIERDAYAVLDDPSVSPLVRQRARERLAAIGIVEESPLPMIEAAQPQKQESTDAKCVKGFSDAERAENRRREQQFFDQIAELNSK
jgi:hypothetical protein